MAKRRASKKSDAIYKSQYKEIKSFVDFSIKLNKPLTKADKAKITKYYNAVDSLTSRTYYVFRSRNKKNLRDLQKVSHADSLPHLKVAFVQVADKDFKPSIRFNKKGVTIKEQYVNTRFIPFDQKKLLKNPTAYINKELKKEMGANSFNVVCGDFDQLEYVTREEVADHVISLMEEYKDPEKNNYYQNWLRGVKCHIFDNQEEQETYVKSKLDSQTKRRLSRAAGKKKQYRKKIKAKEDKIKQQVQRENIKSATKDMSAKDIQNTIKRLKAELRERANATTKKAKKKS